MPKLSAQAVVAAIRQLNALELGPSPHSFLEVFLTGKRYQSIGTTPTLGDIDNYVRDLFVVLPNHPFGRIQPFTKPYLGGNDRRRGWIANLPDTGRSTVWNAGSRGNATELCQNHHIMSGLRPDAAQLLNARLTADGDKRPPKTALLAFLLRDHDFGVTTITQPVLEAAAQDRFSLTSEELNLVTRSIPLEEPLAATPGWSAAELPADLQPPMPAATPAPVGGSAGTAHPPAGHMQIDPRVRQMVERAVASSRAVLLVGPPGTGKSTLLHEVATAVCADPSRFGLAGPPLPDPMWITAEEGWTARNLVGGESIVDGQVVFRPGFLLRSILENRWLVIDEINRADMDRIFGPIFTWLSGAIQVPPVSLGQRSPAPGEPDIELAWSGEATCSVEGSNFLDGGHAGPGQRIRFRAGSSWRLLGTYNAVDAQRVFRVGQALGRRFLRVPIPPASASEFRTALANYAADVDVDSRERIATLYEAHLVRPETALGPALFLRIADYVAAAVELAGEGADIPLLSAAATAEGYLINVGAWLVRLDDDQLDGLGARVQEPTGPLSEAEWTWLKNMVPNLG